MPLTPSDWLLLVLDGEVPIDRVRIQKAMFLFAQRSKGPDEEKYEFRPYHYGPFSGAIYRDLDSLVGRGLVAERFEDGRTSPSYVRTLAGDRRAAELSEEVPTSRLTFMGEIRGFVMARDFNQLLRDVYRLYPAFATKSIFRQ